MAQKIGTEEGDYSPLEFKDVIHNEIDCQEFTNWRQGSTPKEHREMVDREHSLQWQIEREDKDRVFRQQERSANRRYRIAELFLVILTIGVVLAAAFIERSGQPVINIITPNPSEVTIEQQP